MDWFWLILLHLLLFSFLDLVNCVNNNGLSCMHVIVAATKLFPHFLFSVKTNDQNFIIFTALYSEQLKEKCATTVFTQGIFSSL